MILQYTKGATTYISEAERIKYTYFPIPDAIVEEWNEEWEINKDETDNTIHRTSEDGHLIKTDRQVFIITKLKKILEEANLIPHAVYLFLHDNVKTLKSLYVISFQDYHDQFSVNVFDDSYKPCLYNSSGKLFRKLY